LYQIAVNTTCDHYKRADTRYTASDNGEIALVAGPQRPETAVIQQETMQEALTAVAATLGLVYWPGPLSGGWGLA